MLNFDHAAKKATNLSLNVKVLEAARGLGMNLSQREKWNEDNKDAIATYNARIRSQGLPLAKYRTWGKSLGDGRINT
jgi:antitoxin CcdA